MKISIWIVFTLSLMIVLTGCKKKDEEEAPVEQAETGSIFVTVFYNGQPVPDVQVTIDPDVGGGTTDASGTLMIQDVPTGIYHLIGTTNEIGTGSGAVAVSSGNVSEVDIQLAAGVFEDLMVDIAMVYPQNADVGESVTIKAVVNDGLGSEEDIVFEWSTNINGVISTEGADNNGIASIEYSFDSAGEYLLTVSVTDPDGNTDSDSTLINISGLPVPVELEPVEVNAYSLELNWSQTEEEEFSSYRVYREGQFGYESMGTIYDIGTTHFIDDEVSLGVEYNYKISLNLGFNEQVWSNVQSGQVILENVYVGTGLDVIKHHPVSPIIYGLDTDNNSLVIIDTEAQEVVSTITVGPFPTDMDFSLDNQLLYIANSGSTEITVVDLASNSIQNTLSDQTGSEAWEDNPYTLTVLAEGLIAFSGGDQSNHITVISSVDGSIVSTSLNWLGISILTSNSDGTTVFGGDASPSHELYRYNLVGDELILQESINHYGWAPKLIFVTDDDQNVFFGERKYTTANINTVEGVFEDRIFAVSGDGAWVLSEEQVFSGNDFSIVADLPFSTRISVFSNDDASAWLYQEQSARLYKIAVP